MKKNKSEKLENAALCGMLNAGFCAFVSVKIPDMRF